MIFIRRILFRSLWLITLWGFFALYGCETIQKSAEPVSYFAQKALKLENQVNNDIRSHTFTSALENLLQAYRIYALLDNWQGQLRTSIGLTRMYLLLRQSDNARMYSKQSFFLALANDDKKNWYELYLLRGKIENQQAFYQKAKTYAKTPLQQAVALTYLGQHEAAFKLIETQQIEKNLQDQAFVLYEYGKTVHNTAALQKALILFKNADDFEGISNTLYMIAKIHLQEGHPSQAVFYLKRALTVNKTLGQDVRINKVKSLLQQIETKDI